MRTPNQTLDRMTRSAVGRVFQCGRPLRAPRRRSALRSAGDASRIDGLRLGVFAPLRFNGGGFNAETQRRKDAERTWTGGAGLRRFDRGA